MTTTTDTDVIVEAARRAAAAAPLPRRDALAVVRARILAGRDAAPRPASSD